MVRQKIEPIEVGCPRCGHTEIIYRPKEEIPKCPECEIQMVIRELLREGKSY
jgi:ribosomal protein S27E